MRLLPCVPSSVRPVILDRSPYRAELSSPLEGRCVAATSVHRGTDRLVPRGLAMLGISGTTIGSLAIWHDLPSLRILIGNWEGDDNADLPGPP